MKTYYEVCGAIVLLAKKLAASNRVMSIENLSRKFEGLHPYGGRGLIQAAYRYAHAQRDQEAMNALTRVFTRDGLPVWYE